VKQRNVKPAGTRPSDPSVNPRRGASVRPLGGPGDPETRTEAAGDPGVPGAPRGVPNAARGTRRGPPKGTGNVNAAKDPAFTLAMREARRLARRGRRKRHVSLLDAARATVAECGLADSPLGERIAQRLAQVELEIVELGRVVERTGRVKRTGELTPSYEKRLALIREDRVELRALVDKLAEVLAAQPKEETEITYVIRAADGTVVPLAIADARVAVDVTPNDNLSTTLPSETTTFDGTKLESRDPNDRPSATKAPDGANAVPKSMATESVAEQVARALLGWTHGSDLGD